MSDQSTGQQTNEQLLQQGLFHHRQGDIPTAMERYSQVLSRDPKNAEALYYVAVIACQEGQFKQGVDLVRRAISFNDKDARMHNLLGQALDRMGQPLEAIKALDKAIALDPNLAAAHGNRANILVDAGMALEALKSFDRAVELNPQSAADWINRGALLEELGRAEEALRSYDKAVICDPEFAGVHANRASVLKDLGLMDLGRGLDAGARFDEAAAAYDKAVKLNPRLHLAFLGRGQFRVMRGDWIGGFADYEHRGEMEKPPFTALPEPRWDGTKVDGERVVLVSEQGLGDAIQFSRFAPALAAQGHDVTIVARKGMVPLLSTLRGVKVVDDARELAADKRPLRWAPMLSLPFILGTTPETLPREVPYLAADPARVKAWADKLGSAQFRIGINWAPGHADKTQTSRRDIPLAAFAGIAALPGVELISLQKGAPAEQIKGVAFRDRIKVIEADMRGDDNFFLDTAAVMESLDLVIGCDTSVVHLAGALGRPVFTVLPVISDWRWMLDPDRTPWYPTMRLFRQDATQQWAGVFERIAQAVREMMA